jgi:hypothetical protein
MLTLYQENLGSTFQVSKLKVILNVYIFPLSYFNKSLKVIANNPKDIVIVNKFAQQFYT